MLYDFQLCGSFFIIHRPLQKTGDKYLRVRSHLKLQKFYHIFYSFKTPLSSASSAYSLHTKKKNVLSKDTGINGSSYIHIRMLWAFHPSVLQRKIFQCYFNRVKSRHSARALHYQSSLRAPVDWSLRVSSVGKDWISELDCGFLTHWEHSRAQENKKRSAHHMGPFRPLHLMIHFIDRAKTKT